MGHWVWRVRFEGASVPPRIVSALDDLEESAGFVWHHPGAPPWSEDSTEVVLVLGVRRHALAIVNFGKEIVTATEDQQTMRAPRYATWSPAENVLLGAFDDCLRLFDESGIQLRSPIALPTIEGMMDAGRLRPDQWPARALEPTALAARQPVRDAYLSGWTTSGRHFFALGYGNFIPTQTPRVAFYDRGGDLVCPLSLDPEAVCPFDDRLMASALSQTGRPDWLRGAVGSWLSARYDPSTGKLQLATPRPDSLCDPSQCQSLPDAYFRTDWGWHRHWIEIAIAD